jgi:hypothetical protein
MGIDPCTPPGFSSASEPLRFRLRGFTELSCEWRMMVDVVDTLPWDDAVANSIRISGILGITIWLFNVAMENPS